MFLKCGAYGPMMVLHDTFDTCYSKLISIDILVTSSPDSLDETQGGVAKVNTIDPSDTLRDTAPCLHISDKSNRTWIIPLAQCSTWFVSNNRFQFSYRKD